MTVRALSAAVALVCAVAWGADDFYAVREAAEKGDALAQLLIAKAYETGRGAESNAVEAVRWYRKAAEQGHADAQFSMGYCYAKGLGVEKNEAEAMKYFRKAAEQGQIEAQRILKGLGQ